MTPEEIRVTLEASKRQSGQHGEIEYRDPLLPPWYYMPEEPPGSMAWKMGWGDEYMTIFHRWYNEQTEETKKKYRSENPEPEGWENFYSTT